MEERPEDPTRFSSSSSMFSSILSIYPMTFLRISMPFSPGTFSEQWLPKKPRPFCTQNIFSPATYLQLHWFIRGLGFVFLGVASEQRQMGISVKFANCMSHICLMGDGAALSYDENRWTLGNSSWLSSTTQEIAGAKHLEIPRQSF